MVYFEEISPVGREFSWLIDAVDADAECGLAGPLKAWCLVRRTGEGRAVVEGRLEGVALLTCDRCLESYSFPLEAAFALTAEARDAATARADEAESGEADLIELDEPCLDLDELMREQLLLALPEKRLCREDCAGLCPDCGANRNLSPCGCERKTADSPFAALAALKRKA